MNTASCRGVVTLTLLLACVSQPARSHEQPPAPATASLFAPATGVCGASAEWEPVPGREEIDLADFLGVDWQGTTSDGQLFAQIASGPFRTIIKFSEFTWERWKITDRHVLHWEDHNVGVNREPVAAGVYRFTHNGWFPRRTVVGQVVAYEHNWLIRFDGRGNEIDRHPHPYRVRTLALERERSSGRRRVLMEYDPGVDRTVDGEQRDTYERYCLIERQGWRWWGEFSERDGSLRAVMAWTAEPVIPEITPVRGFVPLNPVPPAVSFAASGQREGRAPLRVVAASTPGGDGEIDALEWLYRRPGEDWRIAAVTQRGDREYTFTFEDPGTYEITVRALGHGEARLAEEKATVRVMRSG